MSNFYNLSFLSYFPNLSYLSDLSDMSYLSFLDTNGWIPPLNFIKWQSCLTSRAPKASSKTSKTSKTNKTCKTSKTSKTCKISKTSKASKRSKTSKTSKTSKASNLPHVHQKLQVELLPHGLGSWQQGPANQRRNWLRDLHYLQSALQHMRVNDKREETTVYLEIPFLKWINETKLNLLSWTVLEWTNKAKLFLIFLYNQFCVVLLKNGRGKMYLS